MIKSIKNQVFLFCALFSAFSCASVNTPKPENDQFVPWYYTFTVLLIPEELKNSPRIELAMTLLQVNYPPERAKFLNELLYSADNIDTYKDMVIDEQREKSRSNISAVQGKVDWRYTENVSVKSIGNDGIVIERDFGNYTGGVQGPETKKYYVVDLDELRLLKIDDMFGDFQGNKVREIVYSELRKYSSLEENRPLSNGIFFKDDPELSFNFFLTQEGLGLHWDPHEIAPYSEGRIEIILPWKSIRPLMLHNGMELLTKFGIYLFVG